MSLRKRGDTYFYDFVFRGQRYQESTQTSNSRVARDIERARRTDLARGVVGIKDLPQVERKKVSDLLDARLKDLELRKKDSGTVKSVNKKTKEDFGVRWADTLTDDDVNQYFTARIKEGYKVATIRNRIGELNSAFILAGMKPLKLRPLTAEERDNVRRGFFNKAKFDAIVAQIELEVLQDFCRFGYLTGWRRGSIADLRWDAIDPDTNEITLPGQYVKNEAPLKMVPFDGMPEIIERRRKARGFSPLVFHLDGERIEDFRWNWIKACWLAKEGTLTCRKCGKAPETFHRHCCGIDMKYQGSLFHDFRRTAARDLRRGGASETVAMKITGHKTDSMFRRYDITDNSDIAQALKKMSAYRKTQNKKVRSIA